MVDRHFRPTPKPLKWVGRSKEDLLAFPEPVRRETGYALYLAQLGMKSLNSKPLRGFGGAGALEVVSNHDGNTFRAVYTVKFADVMYVLHAFQKKSKSARATPRVEIDIVRQRLKLAADDYRQAHESR
jgi:phage-related protein